MVSTSELLTCENTTVDMTHKKQSDRESIHKYNMHRKLYPITTNGRRHKAAQCVLCEEKFMNTHFYEDHMIYFHNNIEYPLIYKCEHCSRKFKFKHHMSLHMRKHDGSARFPCKHCREKFVTKKNRRAHIMEAHVRSNIYQCCECTYAFQSKLSLHSHMKDVHKINPSTHNCNKCFALCEYKSAAFVKPAQKPNIDFADTIFEHKELSEMIKARRSGVTIKHLYENDEVIEDVSQEMTKYDVRTVRKSIGKLFSLLHDAKIPKKHRANKIMARRSTAHGSEGESTRAIVIDSVVSLSNHVSTIFDKNLVVKLERIDQMPYNNKGYVEEITNIKLEPIDPNTISPHRSKVYIDHMLNGSNQYLWPIPDDVVSKNPSVDMYYGRTNFPNFDLSKTSISPEKSHFSMTTNLSEISDWETRADDSTSIYQCKYCISKFTTKKTLANHVEKKHFSISLVYKCKKCHRMFYSKPQLFKHMTETHNSEMSRLKHKCLFCAKTFKLRMQLNQHVINSHKYLIRCSECDNLSNNFFSLKRHMKIKHNHSTLYKCDICDAIFFYKNDLKQHYRDNRHLYKCDYCDSNFKRSLIVRLLKVNGDSKIFYKCKVCRLVSDIKVCKENLGPKSLNTNMDLSISNIRSSITVSESILNEKSLVPSKASTALRNYTNEQDMLAPDTELYICQSCRKLYSSNESFFKKIQLNNIEIPVGSMEKSCSSQTCIVCNATLRVGTEPHDRVMTLHKPIEVKMFKCVVCNQLFTMRIKLIGHMRSYHEKYLQLHQCAECDIIFKETQSLEIHRQRKHIKNIDDCITLNKSDSSETSPLKKIDSQMRIIRINVAPREDKIIDLSKLLKCDNCSALFELKSSLQSHIQLEHMPKVTLHKCCLCSTVFYRVTDLDRHLRNKHQLDMELYSSNKDLTNFNLKWKKILTHTYEIEKM